MMEEKANRAGGFAAAAAESHYKNNKLDQRADRRAPHVSVNNSAILRVSECDLN